MGKSNSTLEPLTKPPLSPTHDSALIQEESPTSLSQQFPHHLDRRSGGEDNFVSLGSPHYSHLKWAAPTERV